jgi:hypothetical protein
MMSGISGMGGMMGGMRPDPQQIFNRVDKDGNGGLDESELGAMADKIAERTGKEIGRGGMIDKTWVDEAACHPPWHDLFIWVL